MADILYELNRPWMQLCFAKFLKYLLNKFYKLANPATLTSIFVPSSSCGNEREYRYCRIVSTEEGEEGITFKLCDSDDFHCDAVFSAADAKSYQLDSTTVAPLQMLQYCIVEILIREFEWSSSTSTIVLHIAQLSYVSDTFYHVLWKENPENKYIATKYLKRHKNICELPYIKRLIVIAERKLAKLHDRYAIDKPGVCSIRSDELDCSNGVEATRVAAKTNVKVYPIQKRKKGTILDSSVEAVLARHAFSNGEKRKRIGHSVSCGNLQLEQKCPVWDQRLTDAGRRGLAEGVIHTEREKAPFSKSKTKRYENRGRTFDRVSAAKASKHTNNEHNGSQLPCVTVDTTVARKVDNSKYRKAAAENVQEPAENVRMTPQGIQSSELKEITSTPPNFCKEISFETLDKLLARSYENGCPLSSKDALGEQLLQLFSASPMEFLDWVMHLESHYLEYVEEFSRTTLNKNDSSM